MNFIVRYIRHKKEMEYIHADRKPEFLTADRISRAVAVFDTGSPDYGKDLKTVSEWAKRHGIRLYTVNFEFKAKRAGAADPENTVTIYKDEINIYGIPANTGLKGLLDDRFDLLICTCNGAEENGTMPYPVEFVVKCCDALFKAGTGGRTSLFDMCVSGGKDGNNRKNDNAEQVEFLLHTLSTIKN